MRFFTKNCLGAMSEQMSGTRPRITSKYFFPCESRLPEIFPRIGTLSFPKALDTIEVLPLGFNPRSFATLPSTKLLEASVSGKLSIDKPFREQGMSLPFKKEEARARIASKNAV